MPMQSAIAQVGVAKQASKGTAAANPTFVHGVTGGSILTVEVQQELEEHTSSTRVSPGVNRMGVMAGFDLQTRAHAASAGLWLYGALGTVATTGTTTKTHTFTNGADLPYLTVFGKRNSDLFSVRDGKVDSLGLSWDGNGPVEMSVQGSGSVVGFPSTFTAGTDDSLAAYMRAAGGTFQVDVASATPATAKILSGEVTINNNLSEILVSGSISPDEYVVGKQETEVSFDMVPDNWDAWRSIVTGTSSGSTAAVAPLYGSFSFQFTDGTQTLTLSGSRVAFTCDMPDADPAGGAIQLSLAGLAVQPAAGGSPVSAVLTNTTASY